MKVRALQSIFRSYTVDTLLWITDRRRNGKLPRSLSRVKEKKICNITEMKAKIATWDRRELTQATPISIQLHTVGVRGEQLLRSQIFLSSGISFSHRHHYEQFVHFALAWSYNQGEIPLLEQWGRITRLVAEKEKSSQGACRKVAVHWWLVSPFFLVY